MRTGVAEIAGDRRLRILGAIHPDPGSLAAERPAPLGADSEPRRHDVSASQCHEHARIAGRDRLRILRNYAESRQLPGTGMQRGQEVAILDVVTKGRKADLARLETHLRRAPKSAR